jgi:hypothetical protein
LKHKILDRRGWDNERWRALPDEEREELLALEYARQRAREELLAHLFDGEKVYAESVSMRVLIQLLREF